MTMPDNVQSWSKEMEMLFQREIIDPVRKHPKTKMSDNASKPLGIPFEMIQPNVLYWGRADFRKPYNHESCGNFTEAERALLYCYLNMRGHFHSSRAHFLIADDQLRSGFWTGKPVLIDIGCGPATAALALADLYRKKAFTYIGVDCSYSMLACAKRFFKLAMNYGLIGEESCASFRSKWDIPRQLYELSSVIINFSYLFASESLRGPDIQSIADSVRNIGAGACGPVFMSYTNSSSKFANENHNRFLSLLGLAPAPERDIRIVSFRNRRACNGQIREQKFIREFRELKFQ